jgi:hypothetical protein
MRKLWFVVMVLGGILGSTLAQGSSDGEKGISAPSRKNAVVIVPFRKPIASNMNNDIDWSAVAVRAMEIVEGKLAEMGRKVYKRSDLSEAAQGEMIKLIKQGNAPGQALEGAEYIVQGTITKASRNVKNEFVQRVQRITIEAEVQIIDVRTNAVQKTARGEFVHSSNDNIAQDFTPIDEAIIEALEATIGKLVGDIDSRLSKLDAERPAAAPAANLPPVIRDQGGDIEASMELNKPPAQGKFIVIIADIDGRASEGRGRLAETVVVGNLLDRKYNITDQKQAASVLTEDVLRNAAMGNIDVNVIASLRREHQADYVVQGTIEATPSDGAGIPEVRAKLTFRAFTTATAQLIGMDYAEVVAQGPDLAAALDNAVRTAAERAAKMLHIRLLKWTEAATSVRLVITAIPDFELALGIKEDLLKVPGIQSIEDQWRDGKLEMQVRIDPKRITNLASTIVRNATISTRYELSVSSSAGTDTTIRFVRKKAARPAPVKPKTGGGR